MKSVVETVFCSFEIPNANDERAFVTVSFQGDQVSKVTTQAGNFVTSLGATMSSSSREVFDLYENAGFPVDVTSDTVFGRTTVTLSAPGAGYSYDVMQLCFKSSCEFSGEHNIFAAE